MAIGWGWYRLSTILDDHSHYIIAWELRTTMRAADDTDTLEFKAGVIYFADGSTTAFVGSMNDSVSGLRDSYEILWEDEDPEATEWVPERRSDALRRCGLNPRIPRRASALFMRLVMSERSLTRFSRSRLGRLAASSSIVGITTIPQCPRSPRNQPRNTRINIAASRRSVFARLRSRDTATLAEWMTCASIPRAMSQRASQKPSRPAS